MRTASQTRILTGLARKFGRGYLAPAMVRGEATHWELAHSRSRSVMTYALSFGAPQWVTTFVMFDPEKMEAWVRPIDRQSPRVSDRVWREWREWACNAITEELTRQGYRLLSGSAVIAATTIGAGRIS